MVHLITQPCTSAIHYRTGNNSFYSHYNALAITSTSVDGHVGQCDKLMTVIGHQFITMAVDICVQHGGPEAPHHAGLSAAAQTCCNFRVQMFERVRQC